MTLAGQPTVNMMTTIPTSGAATMSSLEIAELTGKRHTHVLTNIRNMLEQLGLQPTEFSAGYTDAQGKERICFNLPRNLKSPW